jgi:translation elongation factor EF-G
MKKNCFKCGDDKDRSEFYAHPRMADGLLGKCKGCCKTASTKHRQDNLEKVKAYDRQRGATPEKYAIRKAYSLTFAGKAAGNRAKRRNIVRNLEKKAAADMVNNAVRDGRLIKEPCVRCETTSTVEGHHEDYTKPLDVIWLCSKHHKERHREIKAELALTLLRALPIAA